jgi:hypothetical protein
MFDRFPSPLAQQLAIIEGRKEIPQAAALPPLLSTPNLTGVGLPEPQASPMQHFPHSVRGDAHHLADLSIAQALQLAQEEKAPLTSGQAADGLQHLLADVSPLQASLLGFAIVCHVRRPCHRLLDDRRHNNVTLVCL